MFLKFFGKKKAKGVSDEVAGTLVNGIDPELKYCSQCEDEFRADIETCPSCNIALMSGREKIERQTAADNSFNARTMEIKAEDELVSIRKGPLKEVKLLQKILEKERVPSILAGEAGGCGKG